MNRFYTFSKPVQQTVTTVLLLIVLTIVGFWMWLITVNILYYLLIWLLVPVFQFCLTPLFRLMGVYLYLSPMLLVYNPNQQKYDLHNGTSFDYFWVMRGVRAGRSFQNTMLAYYIEGLLKIIKELEAGTLPPDIVISGTSYFFSSSTAARLGFKVIPPSGYLKFNIYLNYIDLLWMYSLARGRLTFPDLKYIKAVEITGRELLDKKGYLENLQQYLRQRTEVPS